MRYTRSIGLLFAILVLLECFTTVSHAKIVFASKRSEDKFYHIYVMEDNGSNVQRVTSPDFYDVYPNWFPDGKRILFERDLERGSGQINSEFYIIDASGRNEHRFMVNHPTDYRPVLSPNGKQIGFMSDRDSDWGELYSYDLESERLRRLTDDSGIHRLDWSPDGRRIAYDYRSDEGENIWIMNADGSMKRQLSPRQKKGDLLLRRTNPRWSPSGKYIMYNERQWKEDGVAKWKKLAQLLIVTNVHTRIRRVHRFPVDSNISSMCWMGNDQTVLLSIRMNWAAPNSSHRIYRYDLVSRQLTRLTNQPGSEHDPHWIRGSLAVFSAGKLTTLWGKLKQTD